MTIVKQHTRQNKSGKTSYVSPYSRNDMSQPTRKIHGMELTQQQVDNVTEYMMTRKLKFISKEDLKNLLRK